MTASCFAVSTGTPFILRTTADRYIAVFTSPLIATSLNAKCSTGGKPLNHATSASVPVTALPFGGRTSPFGSNCAAYAAASFALTARTTAEPTSRTAASSAAVKVAAGCWLHAPAANANAAATKRRRVVIFGFGMELSQRVSLQQNRLSSSPFLRAIALCWRALRGRVLFDRRHWNANSLERLPTFVA